MLAARDDIIENMYEFHSHPDPDFPILFHSDYMTHTAAETPPHWHEAIELLCFTEGVTTVLLDTVPVEAASGDIVVVNSNVLHTFRYTADSRYHCLIVNRSLCEAFGLPAGQILGPVIRDTRMCALFEEIAAEMGACPLYYKQAVKAAALTLLSAIYRQSRQLQGPLCPSPQLAAARRAIDYIRTHFRQPVTTGDICAHVGLSKFYFCRIFKQVTGYTVTDYVNRLRCEHARRMIASGEYNVSESANLSGYQNLSYFTRTYKRYNGSLPSDDR